MMQPYEITLTILGLGVLGYVLVVAREDVRRIPRGDLLLASFAVQFCSWAVSSLHRTFPGDVSLVFESLCTTAATVLLAVWCALTVQPRGVGRP